MKTTVWVYLIVCGFILAESTAASVVITFDEQPLGVLAPNAYEKVIFTSPETGVPRISFDQPTANSNFLTVDNSPNNELTVTFSNPVSDLQFFTFADNNSDMGDIDIFIDGMYANTVDLIGSNGPSTIELQDLSIFERITSIEITGRSDDAVLYDEFRFTVVPEPAALALISFGAFSFILRRHET